MPADPPGCEPLHGFVGLDLCSEFMCMYDVALSNGHVVRAFKHIRTRAYVHLDRTRPGLAYEYTATGRYRAIPLHIALVRAFEA